MDKTPLWIAICGVCTCAGYMMARASEPEFGAFVDHKTECEYIYGPGGIVPRQDGFGSQICGR